MQKDLGRPTKLAPNHIKEEINNPNNYLGVIRDNCCICGIKIHDEDNPHEVKFEWYKLYGNFCLDCYYNPIETRKLITLKQYA